MQRDRPSDPFHSRGEGVDSWGKKSHQNVLKNNHLRCCVASLALFLRSPDSPCLSSRLCLSTIIFSKLGVVFLSNSASWIKNNNQLAEDDRRKAEASADAERIRAAEEERKASEAASKLAAEAALSLRQDVGKQVFGTFPRKF